MIKSSASLISANILRCFLKKFELNHYSDVSMSALFSEIVLEKGNLFHVQLPVPTLHTPFSFINTACQKGLYG